MVNTHEDRLHENAALWSHSHPKEAIWLQFVDVEHLHLQNTSSSARSLRYEDEDFSFSYHSENEPLKEAEARIESFGLEKTDVLFIYGIGLGYDFLAARTWLEKSPKRRLIFLEDNLGVIYRFFETETATEMLGHPQVQLTYLKDLEQADFILNELFWHFQGQPYKIFPSVAYEQYRPRFYNELKHQLTFDMQTKYDLLEEYLEYGAAFFRNFYLNVLEWDRSVLGNHLFGKFKNIPAIICGAGPSLHKNMDVLKKVKNKALIFGGSSSLNALLHAGIVPHFGVGIDPNPKQAERFQELLRLDFPFFYRQRLYHDALNLIEGPRLYITGTGGYDIADWFESKCGIESEEIEEGRNVVNFSLEIASRMGCNPIIFVGMDLGFTDCRLYSPGVITEENKVEVNEIDPMKLSPDVIIKEDIYGKPLHTLWKWVSESKWISDFAEEHPETKLINATEGGLGFEWVENESLQDTLNEWMSKSFRLPSRIKKGINDAKMSNVTREKIVSLMQELRVSLERCIESLTILDQENEKMRKVLKKEGHQEQLQTARSSLVEIELADEEAFQAVLEIFNAVYTKYLDRDIKELSDPSSKFSDVEKDLRRIDLNHKKYTFLSEVAQVNLKLLDFAIKEKTGTVYPQER